MPMADQVRQGVERERHVARPGVGNPYAAQLRKAIGHEAMRDRRALLGRVTSGGHGAPPDAGGESGQAHYFVSRPAGALTLEPARPPATLIALPGMTDAAHVECR
jgi:hypothetical protein